MTLVRILFIILIPFLFTSASPAFGQKTAPAKKTELRWTKFESAIKAAAEEDKPVMVDVYTDWCGWCKKMDKEVFNHPDVAEALNRMFAIAKVNGESRESITYKDQKTNGIGIAQGFGIRGYPSLIFLDSKGDLLTLIPGYVDAEKFLPIVNFLGGKHYETMEWEAYLAEYNASKAPAGTKK
jgi:thioredoxin-related protein